VGGISIGRPLVLAAGVLFVLDTFLPWQTVSFGQFSYEWSAWHGPKGVLLGVLAVALVVWVGADVSGIAPRVKVPEDLTTLALAVLVLTLAIVKNIRDDYSAWGSYLGVVLAAGAVAGAWLMYATSDEREAEPADVAGPVGTDAA
jgi:hypothetical protein